MKAYFLFPTPGPACFISCITLFSNVIVGKNLKVGAARHALCQGGAVMSKIPG